MTAPNRFERIFEQSPVAMLLVHSSGRIELVNNLVEELFFYSREELIGSSINILVPKASLHHHPDLVSQYFTDPTPRQMGSGKKLHGVRKDNSTFPVEVGLNPMEIDGEQYVLSSVIDVSEQQRAEERFKAAFDAAPSGMLMINENREIVILNRKIEEIFGYSSEELLGKSVEVLLPDEFKALHPQFVKSYLKHPEPRNMGMGRELFGRHRSGKLVPLEIGLQPISREGKQFVISSVVDVTARKRNEMEIRSKTAEIEEFAYRTSHDLRAPLKSISGMAECVLLSLKEEDCSSAQEYTTKIVSLSNRLLKLIEDILTLTKVAISTGETEEPFDFQAYSIAFREKYAQSLKNHQVALEFCFSHATDLLVTSSRLIQVLDNLIENAIKYSDPKKSSKFVKVHSFTTENLFCIHITDNGLGIPEERHEEVFSMFRRFHAKAAPGSGLGLYLVRKQVEKLGATISFESSKTGTTFSLEFENQGVNG